MAKDAQIRRTLLNLSEASQLSIVTHILIQKSGQ
tara:strand:+ start:405 stop:506 length:102 start_codon:yes stop_codon:yes gene_type:complete